MADESIKLADYSRRRAAAAVDLEELWQLVAEVDSLPPPTTDAERAELLKFWQRVSAHPVLRTIEQLDAEAERECRRLLTEIQPVGKLS